MTAINACAIRLNLASLENPGLENPGDVITALLKAAVLLRVQFEEFLDHYEMTVGKYSVLMALDHAGSTGLSQAAVADELMNSESNVSSLIDRLQRDGLVDRRWSDKDRRKRVLLLTSAGQVMVDRIEAARRGWAEEILSDVSSNDRRELVSVLSRMPIRQGSRPARNRSGIRLRKSTDKEGHYSSVDATVEGNSPSPQFALERMLSTLGLAGGYSEDE